MIFIVNTVKSFDKILTGCKSTIKSFPLVVFRLTRFIKPAEIIYGVYVYKKREIGTKKSTAWITYDI